MLDSINARSPENTSLLDVRDLVVHPGRGRTAAARIRALDGVSLTVARGETVGVVGESGAGKTTLLRAVVGLAVPTAGRVRLAGEPVDRPSVRRRIGYVPQDPAAALDPTLTILRSVTEPLRLHSQLSRAERQRRGHELLSQVGLDPAVGKRYPHEFSGGQRQRVCIARALSLKPALVLADEPVAALDSNVAAQILQLLDEVRRTTDCGLLLVSHDLKSIRALCDRLVVLFAGRVVEEGATASVLAHPLHPYTQALLAAHGTASGKDDPGDRLLPAPSRMGCAYRPRCPRRKPACAADQPELAHVNPTHRVACPVSGDPGSLRDSDGSG